MSRLLVLVVACGGLLRNPVWAQQCGGEERWAVKMGADPGAAQINVQNPLPTTLHDLAHPTGPTLPSDDATRLPAERSVRVVEGRLVKFKEETGKTGDSDFHLVISDATGLFSLGGPGTVASSHSLVAEIPNPDCVAGREGQVTTPSRFQAEMADVRARFLQRFPDVRSGWNDAGAIPVRLTGVVFFDRQHFQVGRAVNGVELHPLLDIEFIPPSTTTADTLALSNPGFEDSPPGWSATQNVITNDANQPAHSGTGKAWLGGLGTAHTDRLSQEVTLPASAKAISLTFFLHIDTEESKQQEFDRLRVRLREPDGDPITTLKTFSNRDAARGFTFQSFELTAFKGRTVRIALEATEDNGSVTSFVVDDFVIIVEP